MDATTVMKSKGRASKNAYDAGLNPFDRARCVGYGCPILPNLRVRVSGPPRRCFTALPIATTVTLDSKPSSSRIELRPLRGPFVRRGA